MPLKVWEIDGEDLIVDTTERNMRERYHDYHGHRITGHSYRLVPPDEVLKLTDNSFEEDHSETAEEYAKAPGYFPAYR